MEKLYSIKDFAELIGVTCQTLRNWDKSGELKPIRTEGKHRRYTQNQYLQIMGKPVPSPNQRKTVLYARVSTKQQEKDLQNQITSLKTFCVGSGISYDELLVERASALNFERRELKKLLDWIFAGKIERLIVAHKDRLFRFGFELFEQIAKRYEVEILVINKTNKPEFMQELAEDLISIVQHFCAKFYGRRSHKYKKALEIKKGIVEVFDADN